MNEELKKVYRESIAKYPSIQERVDFFSEVLDKKSKEAKKMEKSDPESSDHMVSFISGMMLAYKILRGSRSEGWWLKDDKYETE